MRENLLIEHTLGTILRGAFKLYFHHFRALFLIYVLPVVPVALIQSEAQISGDWTLIIISLLLSLTVSYFAYGAMTVAVSDICLGGAPSFRRSYAKIFSKLVLLLLATNLLQILAIAIGLILLIIPGLVLAIWLLLTPSVVVLERRSGVEALKRSKQLADGSHWRNAGLFLLLMIITALFGGVVGGLFGALFPHLLDHWSFRAILTILQQGLALPLGIVALILVYYDRRVRKEGYDAKALAEDLAR